MLRAAEMGGPDQDWSSLSAAVREEAKLEPYRSEFATEGGQKPLRAARWE